MESMKKIINNEKGFALVLAIIASLILIAIGFLVINMSTGDLRASAATVGDKKALAATESGIHRLMQDFSTDTSTWTTANDYSTNCTTSTPSYIWRTINATTDGITGADQNTQFAICAPTASSLPPLPIPGYAIEDWGMMRYNARVVGRSTTFNTSATVDVGIGYGPVPMK